MIARFGRIPAAAPANACHPPTGTESETVHWLANGTGQLEAVLWFEGAWIHFMDQLEHWPDDMARVGYRYVGPAVPP